MLNGRQFETRNFDCFRRKSELLKRLKEKLIKAEQRKKVFQFENRKVQGRNQLINVNKRIESYSKRESREKKIIEEFKKGSHQSIQVTNC